MSMKFAGELDEILICQCAARFVGGMIAPNAQRHAIARIDQRELAIGLLLARQLWRRALHLHMHPRGHGAVLRSAANFGQRH